MTSRTASLPSSRPCTAVPDTSSAPPIRSRTRLSSASPALACANARRRSPRRDGQFGEAEPAHHPVVDRRDLARSRHQCELFGRGGHHAAPQLHPDREHPRHRDSSTSFSSASSAASSSGPFGQFRRAPGPAPARRRRPRATDQRTRSRPRPDRRADGIGAAPTSRPVRARPGRPGPRAAAARSSSASARCRRSRCAAQFGRTSSSRVRGLLGEPGGEQDLGLVRAQFRQRARDQLAVALAGLLLVQQRLRDVADPPGQRRAPCCALALSTASAFWSTLASPCPDSTTCNSLR